ncbi:MAG: 2-amino-4-hydroxy-6-hydroxymethyldihydropteridine diphosphokinase [Phycisphaerales bacterium]|nr:2-amino-4-hydroxy-6-hydroxymethyldihydropteridine diphosphokinase [Phycisphaerales bacterium]
MTSAADNSEDAYIAVGSNIEPERNIAAALALLRKSLQVTAISTFYRTAAIDRPEQPDFVNGVFSVRTAMGPRALKFDILRGIERQLGRVRTADKYAARTIDLDVVLYGRVVLEDPELHLPDPDIARPFVGLAVLELTPDMELPDSRRPLESLFSAQDRETLQPMAEFTRQLKGSINL